MRTEVATQVLDEEVKRLDKLTKQARRKSSNAPTLEEKLELQRYARALSELRRLRLKSYFKDLAELEAL